jgi:hypothetical protein
MMMMMMMMMMIAYQWRSDKNIAGVELRVEFDRFARQFDANAKRIVGITTK